MPGKLLQGLFLEMLDEVQILKIIYNALEIDAYTFLSNLTKTGLGDEEFIDLELFTQVIDRITALCSVFKQNVENDELNTENNKNESLFNRL